MDFNFVAKASYSELATSTTVTTRESTTWQLSSLLVSYKKFNEQKGDHNVPVSLVSPTGMRTRINRHFAHLCPVLLWSMFVAVATE